MVALRRSKRLLQSGNEESTSAKATKRRLTSKAASRRKANAAAKNVAESSASTKRLLTSKAAKKTTSPKKKATSTPLRRRESDLSEYTVIGIDEAGRGPLAGPVVAAAAIVPHDLEDVMDSKKLTKEEEREEVYEKLIQTPGIQWAVAVIDAARIDEINILQATMEGMCMAASAVIAPPVDMYSEASVKRQGSYVVGNTLKPKEQDDYFALLDGNRVPQDMPCEAESIVKGDASEYCISAASIIAKVTRDRLMKAYDEMYPIYNLQQHKGYPTAAHMALVRKHGASPIHRRTFAPLKHMIFDKDGRVLSDDSFK